MANINKKIKSNVENNFDKRGDFSGIKNLKINDIPFEQSFNKTNETKEQYNYIGPFIKWPGGKQEELRIIAPNLPKEIDRFVEPFVGGGAVYFSINNANSYHINDKSEELIELYKLIKNQDNVFLDKINQINHNWVLLEELVTSYSIDFLKMYSLFRNDEINDNDFGVLIERFIEKHKESFNGLLRVDFNIDLEHFIAQIKRNLISKTKRMKKIESTSGVLSNIDIMKNIEAAFKSGTYMHFRYLYNNIDHFKIENSFRIALFYFMREFCYSSMFRYNSKGEFNVPYGGVSYNRKNFDLKIQKLSNENLVEKLNKTKIECHDFEVFLDNLKLTKDDFIFLDPPYDTDFSTYAKNKFDQNDQKRLANYLKKTNANFMIVIKNTDFIYELYKEFNIIPFDKKYLVSFQNRNDKNVEHLLITNYDNEFLINRNLKVGK